MRVQTTIRLPKGLNKILPIHGDILRIILSGLEGHGFDELSRPFQLLIIWLHGENHHFIYSNKLHLDVALLSHGWNKEVFTADERKLRDAPGCVRSNWSCISFCLFVYFFYCSGFCHTLKWNSHGFTCVPHPDSPSHLPLHPIPLGLPSAPGPSACLMHPTWAGDLFHPR